MALHQRTLPRPSRFDSSSLEDVPDFRLGARVHMRRGKQRHCEPKGSQSVHTPSIFELRCDGSIVPMRPRARELPDAEIAHPEPFSAKARSRQWHPLPG